MIALILLVAVAVVITLYFTGTVPGTGPYVMKKYNLNAVKGIEEKNFASQCEDIKKLNIPESDDTRYFTLTGFKTTKELIPVSNVQSFFKMYEMCSTIDKEKFMYEEDFERAIKSSGLEAAALTWQNGTECDEALRDIQWDSTITGVVNEDKELISVEDYLKNKHPSISQLFQKC